MADDFLWKRFGTPDQFRYAKVQPPRTFHSRDTLMSQWFSENKLGLVLNWSNAYDYSSQYWAERLEFESQPSKWYLFFSYFIWIWLVFNSTPRWDIKINFFSTPCYIRTSPKSTKPSSPKPLVTPWSWKSPCALLRQHSRSTPMCIKALFRLLWCEYSEYSSLLCISTYRWVPNWSIRWVVNNVTWRLFWCPPRVF